MKKGLYFIVILLVAFSCREGDLVDIEYNPTPYIVEGTEYLGPIPVPPENQLTHEGIKLGQHLFYDPILSADNSMSCASCHFPEKAFTDGNAVSVGIDGIAGTRSAMSLVNAAYYTKGLFWDGRSENLEEQALIPVEDEIELHHNWGDVIEEFKEHPTYPQMFREAFGIEDKEEIRKELAAKALAQFQRIIISGNSKFDRVNNGIGAFNEEQFVGLETFFDVNPLIPDGECGHCHNDPLFTTNQYFDNGIQDAKTLTEYTDIGLASVTSRNLDYGKMRAPTLRNIELTAPYMHDGRFQTLEEVVEHYSKGGHATPNRDPLIFELGLSEEQKTGLVAFMKALTDTSYLENPYVRNPFK